MTDKISHKPETAPHPSGRQLEICAFSPEAAKIAAANGAHRVELCENASDGGTTPSFGTIRKVRESISIELYPIIRPRGLNFLYADEEFEIMILDIAICKELGCDGISIGIQLQNGEIDLERMKRAVEVAYPMGVTCNRVIDRVPNPEAALEGLISIGVERVLTSGQGATAMEGIEKLTAWQKGYGNDIIIMPGAGVRSNNLLALMSKTGCSEYHTSARLAVKDEVAYANPAIADSGKYWIADREEIGKMAGILNPL